MGTSWLQKGATRREAAAFHGSLRKALGWSHGFVFHEGWGEECRRRGNGPEMKSPRGQRKMRLFRIFPQERRRNPSKATPPCPEARLGRTVTPSLPPRSGSGIRPARGPAGAGQGPPERRPRGWRRFRPGSGMCVRVGPAPPALSSRLPSGCSPLRPSSAVPALSVRVGERGRGRERGRGSPGCGRGRGGRIPALGAVLGRAGPGGVGGMDPCAETRGWRPLSSPQRAIRLPGAGRAWGAGGGLMRSGNIICPGGPSGGVGGPRSAGPGVTVVMGTAFREGVFSPPFQRRVIWLLGWNLHSAAAKCYCDEIPAQRKVGET